MVSFWPWRADNSAESFEKTLSALAAKIAKASAQNEQLRKSARRLTVSWTLYGGFAYICALLIFTLVTGWSSWGPMEYSVVSGGPVVLYGVRRVLSAIYSYRISKSQAHLDSLYQEKDTTIEKLKQATKYNSTQQLLEKYGERKSPPKEPANESDPAAERNRRASSDRVFIVPPPTANIPRNRPSLSPGSAQDQDSSRVVPSGPYSALDAPQQSGPETTAEFAPNAFDQSAQYARPGPTERRWFDRLLDSIMGEDETLAATRLALVCSQCRLVNGLAPPGVRTLEEVGKWRCRECGAWNGEEPEAVRIVKAVATESTAAKGASNDSPVSSASTERSDPAEAEAKEE